jgi:hypothetical protein
MAVIGPGKIQWRLASHLTCTDLSPRSPYPRHSPELAHLARRDKKDSTWQSAVSAGSFAPIGDLVLRVLRNFGVRHLNS